MKTELKNVKISLNNELFELYQTFHIDEMKYLVEYTQDSSGILEYEMASHQKKGYCPLCQKFCKDDVYDDICHGIDENERLQKELTESLTPLT